MYKLISLIKENISDKYYKIPISNISDLSRPLKTVKESSSIQMEMYILGHGNNNYLMDRESIFFLLDKSMMDY